MNEIRVKVDSIELQIQDYEHAGEAIIFLHFSGSNLMMWQHIRSYFHDKYRLILVDLRGHGKSDRPESGYQMDKMARDILGVMQHLELEQAHLVGSSIGAEVALSLAAYYPEKVLSLVLDGALTSEFGPYSTWEGSEADFEAHVAGQLENIRSVPDPIYPSLEELVAERRELFEKYSWWNTFLEAVVRYDAYPIGDGKFARGMGKQANLNYMGHYYHYRFEDYYPRLKCPVLILVEKDLEDEREKAAIYGLSELVAQVEIAEINDWAHPYMWFLEPEEACQAILNFLDNTKTARG